MENVREAFDARSSPLSPPDLTRSQKVIYNHLKRGNFMTNPSHGPGIRSFFFLFLLIPALSSASWDNLFGAGSFGLPGANGRVLDLEFVGADLFACGLFGQVDGVVAYNIARWDGASWYSLGSGIAGPALAMVSFRGDLYVGGDFLVAGGVTVSNLARWDGSAWHAVAGSPTDGSISSLAVWNDNLYVGGGFDTADGISVENVARWDGENWFALDVGVSGGCSPDNTILALQPFSGDLVIGGCFTTAGTEMVSHITTWDGSTFAPMGTPDPGVWGGLVHAMTLMDDNLIVAGGFHSAGGLPTRGLARWDGNQWGAVAEPLLLAESFHPVQDVVVHGDDLIVTGEFDQTLEGDPLPGIARWTAQGWDDMDGGLSPNSSNSGIGYALAVKGDTIIVGGYFTAAGGMAQTNLAMITGSGWATHSVNNRVRVAVSFGDDVLVGGDFDYARGEKKSYLALWDGTDWLDFGGGVNGPVHALVVDGNDVYVGGAFTEAGGLTVANIARWDGQQWHDLGGGIQGPVYSLAMVNGNLFAGGEFLHFGDAVLRNIGRWDGAAWSSLDIGTDGPVHALFNHEGLLVVGGNFTHAGTDFVGHVAGWENDAWVNLGFGFDLPVHALETHGGQLFAGGEFTTGVVGSLNHLAWWDGINWQPVPANSGNGVDGPVYTLESGPDGLYLGGDFNYSGQLLVQRMARWDGNGWFAIDQGVDGTVLALLHHENGLFAGGDFRFAGTQESFKFAHWREIVSAVPTESIVPGSYLSQNSPNPLNPNTSISYSLPHSGYVDLSVFNLAGKKVRTLVSQNQAAGNTYSVQWDGKDDSGQSLPSGVYLYRLAGPSLSETKKMILLK